LLATNLRGNRAVALLDGTTGWGARIGILPRLRVSLRARLRTGGDLVPLKLHGNKPAATRLAGHMPVGEPDRGARAFCR